MEGEMGIDVSPFSDEGPAILMVNIFVFGSVGSGKTSGIGRPRGASDGICSSISGHRTRYRVLNPAKGEFRLKTQKKNRNQQMLHLVLLLHFEHYLTWVLMV